MADFFWLLVLAPSAFLLAALYLLVRPRPVRIPIKNRHVFITGGSSGIGLALAHRAAAEGATRVSLLARSQARLDEAAAAIRLATGVDVATYSADVRDADAGLLSHLGMTGRWLRRLPDEPPPPHSRARLHLADGAILHNDDPRMFGRLFVAAASTLPALPEVRALGPDPSDI